LIETLQAAGVKTCYRIVGDTLNRIAYAIDRSDIDWVHIRHELARSRRQRKPCFPAISSPALEPDALAVSTSSSHRPQPADREHDRKSPWGSPRSPRRINQGSVQQTIVIFRPTCGQ